MGYLVAILFAMLPLYLVRFTVFGIPTTAFEAALYGVFVCALAGSLRRKDARSLFSLPQEKLFRAGFSLLLIGAALSVAFNPTLRALGILKGWFFDPVLFFLLVRHARASTNSAVLLYSASAFAVAIVALGYWTRGIVTYDGRLASFFASPNHLAMFLAPALLLVAVVCMKKVSCMRGNQTFQASSTRSQFPKFQAAGFGHWDLHIGNCLEFGIWLLVCAVLLTVLLLTTSHGAWFGVAGALFASFVFSKISEKLRIIFLTAGIVLGMTAPIFAVRFWPRLQNAFGISERSSIASRIQIWRSAFAIGRENPVFGIGSGAFQEEYLVYQKNYPPYLEWAVPQPHNIYLAFWLQTGFLGLAGFLLLLVWFFRKSLNDRMLDVGFWIFLVMLYTLLHGSVDTLYWKNDLSVIFWALLALTGR